MEAFLCGGGAAICAITCTHPIDVVKTRLQVQGELQRAGVAGTGAPSPHRAYRGIVSSLGLIARHEGVRGLYRGLLPAYGLQFSVTAVRFAVYDIQKRTVGEEFGKLGKADGAGAVQQQSWLRNFAMGAVSGVAGGVCGCPFYLLKTQFQTYAGGASSAVGTQHHHRGVISAFVEIGRQHGLWGYFRGLDAFLPRVCVYAGVQVATYDGVKTMLRQPQGLDLADTFTTHVLASMVTTTAAVTALQPFDFLATRLMNQAAKPGGHGGAQYANVADCAMQTLRTEGVRGFFKGAATNYARFTPYGILQLVLIEQFKALSARFKQ